jgi:hypothetical protein
LCPKQKTAYNNCLATPSPRWFAQFPNSKPSSNRTPSRNKAEGASFWVTFLEEAPAPFPLQLPATIPNTAAQIIAACGAEVFSVTHGGGEGGKPNPFLEAKLKMKATTRSINVIEQIVQKYTDSKT